MKDDQFYANQAWLEKEASYRSTVQTIIRQSSVAIDIGTGRSVYYGWSLDGLDIPIPVSVPTKTRDEPIVSVGVKAYLGSYNGVASAGFGAIAIGMADVPANPSGNPMDSSSSYYPPVSQLANWTDLPEVDEYSPISGQNSSGDYQLVWTQDATDEVSFNVPLNVQVFQSNVPVVALVAAAVYVIIPQNPDDDTSFAVDFRWTWDAT